MTREEQLAVNTLLDPIARSIDEIADTIAQVLDEGTMDDRSREVLGGLCRILNGAAAMLGADTVDQVSAGERDDDELYRQSRDHVGSLQVIRVYLPISCRWRTWEVGLPIWLDELDQLDERALVGIRGIGRKTSAAIRHLVDVYYWRSNPDDSRELWRHIHQYLQQALKYQYLQEPDRVRQGIRFAEAVLREDGAQLLADRHAARLAVAA